MFGLWLCAVAIVGAAGARQPARVEEPAEASMALQDLSDAMQIKPQFNAFLNRVNADADKLHSEVQAESAKVSDLELEKQSMEGEMRNEKERLTHELAVFKQKMIAKITDLKTTNRRLEETNMQLVSTNDKLAQQLEAEKGKKAELVKRLKKMATMFTRQQQTMQQIIQSNSMKLENEVSDDVKDAMNNVNSEGSAPSVHQPLPTRAAPVDTDVDDDEDDVDKITATEDNMPKSPVFSAAPSQPQPRAPQPQAQVKQAQAVQALPKAVAPAAPKKSPAPVAAAHKAVAKPVSSSSDDDQLKALRAEVENLESSVKTDDEADAAGPASSMLHIKKSTTKKTVVSKAPQSSSVDTLQQVGGMLSAAMAESDDDDGESA